MEHATHNYAASDVIGEIPVATGDVDTSMGDLSFSSLRVRLMLLVLLSIFPTMALLFYNVAEERRHAAFVAQESALRVAREVASDHQQLIDGARQLLMGLSQVPAIRTLDAEACSTLFADILRKFSGYTNLAVVTPTGSMVCSGLPFRGPINIADRPYFQETLNQRGFTGSEYSTDPVTGKASIAIGYPVFDAVGVARAFLFAGLDLSWGDSHVEAQLPGGSVVTLIDGKGTILSRLPDGDRWVGQTMPDAPIVRFALAQRGEGSAELPGLDGVRRLHVFTPLRGFPDDRFKCIVGIPVDAAFAEVDRALRRSLIWLASVTALALLAAWVGGNIFVLRHTRALVDSAKRLSGGDLSVRSGLPTGQGELSQLGQAFDEMAAALEAREVETKQADEALVKRTTQLDAVRLVSTEITRELDLVKVLALIHRRAIELVGAGGGSLYLWDEAAQQLIPRVWQGVSDSVGVLALRLGEGLCGVVAERGVGVIVDDYRTFPHAHPQFLAETGITAAMAEPLRYRDRLVGVVAVNHQDRGRSFTEEDQRLLGFFATQAAIAIENARLYRDAERQRREIELVDDLSQRLNASLDLNTVLQRVAEGARDLTGSDLAQIALRDVQSDLLVFRYRAGAYLKRLDTHRIEPGNGIGGRVMVTKQPFRTSNYAEDPRITKDYLGHVLAEDIVAELAVPIQMEGRVEGVLFVANRSSRPFTDRDERTLQRLASHAATAVGNARLHATALQRAQQLEILNTLIRVLTTELEPQAVTRQIMEAVRVLIPAAAGLLFEQPEGIEEFRVVASIGLQESGIETLFRLRAGEGVAGVAAMTRQPIIIADISRDVRFVNKIWAASEGLVSGIILPLVYGDRVLGILSVFLRLPHTFTGEEVDLLRGFAAQGAVALGNARLFEQVHTGRKQLLDLAQRVVSVQEEERHRLSRELHDETGQTLTALRISLGLIRDDLPAEANVLRQQLSETVALAESVNDQVRRLAQALHPPSLDALGLNVTLEGFCRDFGGRTRLCIDYAGADILGLPDSIGIHLYRFLQEALTNVSKHAQADGVRVVLEYDGDSISLLVEDDGVGFDVTARPGGVPHKGIGLIGMRERIDQIKGRLAVTSQPGIGTRLVAWVPWRGTT
jgi:signal transduction histidine kinase/HAMP domain-containing protein